MYKQETKESNLDNWKPVSQSQENKCKFETLESYFWFWMGFGNMAM